MKPIFLWIGQFVLSLWIHQSLSALRKNENGISLFCWVHKVMALKLGVEFRNFASKLTSTQPDNKM